MDSRRAGLAYYLRSNLGDVLVITFDRPQQLNAMPASMFGKLVDEFNDLRGARAVLLKGSGRAFCSGADVRVVSREATPGDQMYAALTESCNPVLLAMAELDVPIVSAVRGAAAGIGCSLALAADFCLASDTAYFLQAFVNIGLVPDGGASWSLPRIVGRARALEMMLLGERISAATALTWGMIHKIVADQVLDAEALALAERLARGPTLAYGAIRQQLYAAQDGSYAMALAREAKNQRRVGNTTDAAEGTLAFLQKRSPQFEGK